MKVIVSAQVWYEVDVERIEDAAADAAGWLELERELGVGYGALRFPVLKDYIVNEPTQEED